MRLGLAEDVTTYTCSQCGESAPAFDKTPDGRKTIDLPRGWATVTLSGTPELHKLLCGDCVKELQTFFKVVVPS